MIFTRNFVTLLIVSISSMFLLLFGSCSNEPKTKADNLKEHMGDSTIGHVPIFVKRSKMVFVNEPVKNEKSPIFTANQYMVDVEQSELEWFCSRHTGFVKFKSGELITKGKQLTLEDEIIICGISYWHVDRQEIDKYLTSIASNIDVYLINPNPPSVFNAVLTTIFKNVIVYKKSDNLGQLK